MSQQVCPACYKCKFDLCEFVNVVEQHRLYAPENQETQDCLSAAPEIVPGYQMLRCSHCGLEFSDPMLAPSAAWYHLAYRALQPYPGAPWNPPHRWEFDEVLSRIPKSDSIFEFGCGFGPFLKRCKEEGVQAQGIDFSEDAVANCLSSGLAAERVDLYKDPVRDDANRFSQLAAFQFLEHLDKPFVLFEQAAARALPSAHFWVSVPGDHRPSRYFAEKDFLDEPPHHMTRWTPGALAEIGRQFGWRLAEMLHEPISLRTAIWSISVRSPTYLRWKDAGRFRKRKVEKLFRAVAFPAALLRRIMIGRKVSGFSMLAHFVFDTHSQVPVPLRSMSPGGSA